MDWKNVNLKSVYERDQNILDPISFDSLILEINCNLPVKSKEEIKKQFERSLQAHIVSAREIFKNNLQNIVDYANSEY